MNNSEIGRPPSAAIASCAVTLSSSKTDIIWLPDDILCYIFACCEARELLLVCNLACKHWNELIQNGRPYLLEPWWGRKRESSKWVNEGKYYLKKKMWTPAIASFSRAIFLNPRDGNSFSFRATAYQKKGMYEEALKDFAKVLEFNPKDAGVVYNNRGFLFNKMGRFEEAMKENGKAIELDTNDDIAYNNRGFALNSLGRYEEALKDYSKALELDPNYSIAFNNRGYAYNCMGKYEEALKDYNKALELDPKRINTYNNRGFLYESLGKFDEALADYNRALELDPEDSIATNLKAALLRKIECVQKAREEFLKNRAEFTRLRNELLDSSRSNLTVTCIM